MKLSVVRMNGEAILSSVEVSADESVDILMKIIANALRKERVWRLIASSGELAKDASIEKSGLADGDVVTVLTKPKPVAKVVSSRNAAVELKEDGAVVPRGTLSHSEPAIPWSSVQAQLATDVQYVYANTHAFAALKDDGSVVAWGDRGEGGDCSAIQAQLLDVQHLCFTERAFAALKEDGTVLAWGSSGDYEYGGDCSRVQQQLVDVQSLYSTHYAFAALKVDGGVVSWGSGGVTGYFYFNDYHHQAVQLGFVNVREQLTQDVQSIQTTVSAFAALKLDGSVVSWGSGDPWGRQLGFSKVRDKLTMDVQCVYASKAAFAALKADGTVVAWGDDKKKAKKMANDSMEEQIGKTPKAKSCCLQ
eukprot:gnl/MRDRNA2_/MRDRNA2_144139_c0_seq1.p1 gnl/MRDRNA2_/MRDRNA2_144139_c0~~gnl/MRDRNA2_/MRDRNA2_144139_c0_seq1.p1  ORF type:complete len:362 (-),score=98.45 gnl/MRDRNA2_/MRDRNA2_144139_c0_seq1:260-1345(-)